LHAVTDSSAAFASTGASVRVDGSTSGGSPATRTNEPVSSTRSVADRPDFAAVLARFACGLTLSQLPAHAVAAAQANLFDTLACAIAGSNASGVAEVLDLAREWGGAAQAAVFCFGDRVPAHHAAWVNATMAHARDYDDTHDAAVLHAGVSVVPAALAAAELRLRESAAARGFSSSSDGPSHGASGADVIAALAAGLETICRLGVATRIGIIESGFIYTPLFGHFAATVAAGRVLGLTEPQMVNALGIVYSQVAGNHQVTRDGALTKRMQPGFAAKAALVSVQLARKNVRGPQQTFDGIDGFLRVYLRDRCDGDALRHELGQRYEFVNLSYKPYPCCRFNHTAIDAALSLRARHAIEPRDIRRVEVGLNRQAYEAVCTPASMRKTPETIVHAQFSIPFTVAAALCDGRVGLSLFTEDGIRRADVLALAQRVDGVVDESIERQWSRNISPAHVRVEMNDGHLHDLRVDLPRGHPDQPMSTADFDAKLRDCIDFSRGMLAADAAARLRAAVDALPDATGVDALLRAVAPGR
jgi:2-methylcitrate dehydratase PrpD